MEKSEITITEYGEWYKKENMTFTYSEEEKQNNEINKENAKKLFSPEFVPFYMEEYERYKFSLLEWLVYWFIRFYMKNWTGRFFFSSDDLSQILHTSKWTIDNTISSLKKMWLIQTGQKIRAWWWTIRFIMWVLSDNTTKLTNQWDYTSPTSELHIKKNKINNILYIKNISEFENLLTEDEKQLYRNEIYIIWVMMKLWYSIKHEIKDGVSPNLTIIENFMWLKDMLSRYIPRKEDWKLDRNKAKAETYDWYIYWKNPPKWKKAPTNFQLSLTNWMKPKQRKK